jgi:hypothetical protein
MSRMELRSVTQRFQRPVVADFSCSDNVDWKAEIVRKIKAGESTAQIEAENHHIQPGTVRQWVSRDNLKIFRGIVGRPRRVTTPVKLKVIGFVEEGATRPKMADINAKIQTEAQEFEANKMNKGLCQVDPLSISSLRRAKIEMGIKSGRASAQTKAREAACADLINFAAFAAANYLMVPKVHPAMNVNVDASQMKAGYDTNKKVEVGYVKGEGERRPDLKARPEEGKQAGITCHFIKYYCCISAGGFAADPIFVVADERMKEGEIACYKVPGLGISTTAGSG